jgi:hypothetical protein
MRYGYCALLMLLGIATAAHAQGIGMGMGMDDARRFKAGAAAPQGNLVLLGGGNISLLAGGIIKCIGNC